MDTTGVKAISLKLVRVKFEECPLSNELNFIEMEHKI